MKVFQDIKPSDTRKTLLNLKGQNCSVPENDTCIILFLDQVLNSGCSPNRLHADFARTN